MVISELEFSLIFFKDVHSSRKTQALFHFVTRSCFKLGCIVGWFLELVAALVNTGFCSLYFSKPQLFSL